MLWSQEVVKFFQTHFPSHVPGCSLVIAPATIKLPKIKIEYGLLSHLVVKVLCRQAEISIFCVFCETGKFDLYYARSQTQWFRGSNDQDNEEENLFMENGTIQFWWYLLAIDRLLIIIWCAVKWGMLEFSCFANLSFMNHMSMFRARRGNAVHGSMANGLRHCT